MLLKTGCCCKDCTKRQLHCHSTCEDYKQFRKELDEKQETINKAQNEVAKKISYYADVGQRLKKRYGGR